MEKNLNLNQHISQKFNEDLERLRTDVLNMGGLVQNQLSDAIHSLVEKDSVLAESVLKNEDTVDHKEIAIDDICAKILARRQPTASDLRLVLAVSKMLPDLERIGDESAKIAKFAIELREHSDMKGYIEVRHIGFLVHRMLQRALDAFARFDVELAVKVVGEDKEVDTEYTTAVRELMTYMMEDSRSITRVMKVLWVLRSLERVGDHARNIAEHLLFLVKGKDVRHISYQEMKEKILD
ncbi:MAG: phosphate signaling complex protein PhoU [Pseudomonadales bacterium]|nr:phosphate signaling complex protein PhoU [Pseudomonadales bacterium]